LQPDFSIQPTYIKFAVPTIASGKLYLGGTNSVTVLGLSSKILSINRDRESGIVELTFISPRGGAAVLQVSEDLLSWSDLGFGTSTGMGTFTFIDSQAMGRPTRFYRVR